MRTSNSSWDAWDRLSRVRKAVVVTVWVITMLSLIYVGYLYTDYGFRRPGAPEQETDRIYPFDFKGRTVYVTKQDWRRYRIANYIFNLSWATGFLTFVVWGRVWKRRIA